MKKLVFGLCIALIAVSITLVIFIKRSENSSEKPGSDHKIKLASVAVARSKVPTQVTLNGYSPSDADDMVNAFEQGRTGDDNSRTNVWFSKGLFHKIRKLLDTENADGLRIYFARDVGTENDNMVMVSTRDGGRAYDPVKKDTVNVHTDYFEHLATFLTALTAKDLFVDHNPSGNGARLYEPNSPCGSSVGCSIVPIHDLSCDSAYQWVRNFSLSVTEKENTTSEFFDINFINKFDNELQRTTTSNSYDGVRIYFAKRRKDKKLVFVWTTTMPSGKLHMDYYDCFPNFRTNDNGEQCPNNCNGTTWPQ